MTTIYIVTEGEYSDYSIIAVCSTRAKADALCEVANTGKNSEYAQVEEYELDDHDNAVITHVCHATINKASGEMSHVGRRAWTTLVPHPRWSNVWESMDGNISAESAVSQDHAIKLAVEARQKWLREQGGVT